MEYLLNLLWLAVVTLLCVAAVRAHARGRLRCSLRLALGCVALLAIVLFPALSMTDDLQRARFDTESMGRHLGDALHRGSLEDAQHLQTLFLPTMMLMLWAGCMVARRRISRDAAGLPGSQMLGMRPEAIRPPPSLAWVDAVESL